MPSVPHHTPGVYAIRNKVRGRIYIGSTVNTIRARWNSHVAELRRGLHICVEMQRDWNELGPDSFIVDVLIAMPERSEAEIRAAEFETIADYRRMGRRLYNSIIPAPFDVSGPEMYSATSWEWCPLCGALVPRQYGVIDRGILFCSLKCCQEWAARA